eukprot:CAMPEP_0182437046 /NCGR_PEP_ID=MMETSP1167-20130531/84778_1 /TAXON_ID=2988 /ORGANISM="Mallomonas Sp, Strain CCMP3275" /LENGTH=348 /DNA_ID=CAMNT_0024629821 /DNA_START=34 /DNA_END=1077 /DNA_ORIENTATION=-
MAAFLDSGLSSNKTALVLIEFQNEFTTEGGKLHGGVRPVMEATNMLNNTMELCAFARSKGIKIFHVPITFSDDYREVSSTPFGILKGVKDGKCFPASGWGGEFCAGMQPAEGEFVVQGKRGLCGFSTTNLDFMLRQNDIDTIALGGFQLSASLPILNKNWQIYLIMVAVGVLLSLLKTALVLIEYQNEFTTEGGKLHEPVKAVMEETNMLSNSIDLCKYARSKRMKIFHVPITFSDDYRELAEAPYGILKGVKDGKCFPASGWGGEFCEGMQPADGEIVVQGKRGLCGFSTTNLDFMLRQNDIDTIALGGFLTNCCVESTMRAAYEKGYNVITLTDCTAATSMEGQEA